MQGAASRTEETQGAIGPGGSLFCVDPQGQRRLPKRLREISGLALTPDGRVMGHDDEVAVICEIAPATGDVAKSFSLGKPPETGDFEGLAIDGRGVFHLITSTGRLLGFREGAHHAHIPFETFDTGMSDIAEVEGLAFHAGEDLLIIACKINYAPDTRACLALWAWSPQTPHRLARPWLTVPVAPLAEAVGANGFHPSSLEIDPATGRLVIVAGRENAMVELDGKGRVLAARWLGRRHRQAEGATILASGDLLITDEGGHGRARMTCYGRLADA